MATSDVRVDTWNAGVDFPISMPRRGRSKSVIGAAGGMIRTTGRR